VSCIKLKLEVQFLISRGKPSETGEQLEHGASREVCLPGSMTEAAETGLVLVAVAKTSPTIQTLYKNQQIGNKT